MNTKTILFALPEWPQFISIIDDLKLLGQFPAVRLLLEKRHIKVDISRSIIYRVINKDVSTKISSTLVQSVISHVDISIATEQYVIVSRWIPTVKAFTKMDPSQSESLMKLPISIEQDSLRCESGVLIDSATTLRFFSRKSLNRNSLVGECIRGPKIVIYNARGQQDPQCFLLAAIAPPMPSFIQNTFLGCRFQLSFVVYRIR